MDRAHSIHIKFCGLTRLEDAVAAIQAGADMLGFNFFPKSPRYLAPADCASFVDRLRSGMSGTHQYIQFVGVFVNTAPQEIDAIMERCHLDLAQLSGDEMAADVDQLGGRAFKAIRSDGRQTLAQIGTAYPLCTKPPALLVDAASPGLYGGSGHLADWAQAEALARRAPILLAGGLTPSNVAEAVQAVQPWGVDVASGIEDSPGVKNHLKMVDFVQAVRALEQHLQ